MNKASCSLNSPADKRLAFTLIELMTVVSIIAVLVALLIPALQSAQNRAKTAGCANNVRQIGVGFNSFLGDNNQWYPYIAPDGATCQSTGYMWHRQLGPYVGGTNSIDAARIFYCPSNPWSLPIETLAQGSPTTYGMNSCVFPSNWNSWHSSGYCPTGSSLDLWSRTKATDIPYPTTLMITGEAPYSWYGSPYGLILPDGTVSNLPFDWPGYSNYWQTASIALRCLGNCHPQCIVPHNLSWNSLMGDGHVQLVTKAAMIAEGGIAQNDGFSPLWNSGFFMKPATYLNCPYPY